ncbi:hypothetical protein NDU88_000501 [Pleurodeles waltl]|uniref:Uncharacterized protein n=1 Tax=Pleurodeles waltl TaxID=8319 RepID=A0AAV7UQ58_PLEWA|nr:hypothetical protein NDU88_000501 [Pleurodeles waltl]
MEPNRVVQALKTLRDEGREDLIKDGVLEEAWVGLKRPKRLSSEGVSAAVVACSSPRGKSKKFTHKSTEGRKVTRSPEGLGVVLPAASRSLEDMAPRRKGAGRGARRSGMSLAQRVAAGERGVGRIGAVASVKKQGAQRLSACASEAERGRRAAKQAQLQLENTSAHRTAIFEERRLRGTFKMAAPSGKAIPLTGPLERKQLGAEHTLAARVDNVEEIIVISNEEQGS